VRAARPAPQETGTVFWRKRCFYACSFFSKSAEVFFWTQKKLSLTKVKSKNASQRVGEFE